MSKTLLVVERIFKPTDLLPPEYKSELASGFDLQANLVDASSSICLLPGQARIIPTGLFIAIPEGYELQIRSRSGLAIKEGLVVLNSPGTVDADYRGEIKVIMYNASDSKRMINHGDRIAQGVVCPVVRAMFVDVQQLSITLRGDAGFGSTGK